MAEPIAFWTLAVVLVGSALAVVLSKNLLEVEPKEIMWHEVLYSVVGGKVVYRKP